MQNNNNKNKHNVNIMSNTELGLSTNNNNIKYNQHIITNNKCLLTITIIEMRWSVEYDYRGVDGVIVQKIVNWSNTLLIVDNTISLCYLQISFYRFSFHSKQTICI